MANFGWTGGDMGQVPSGPSVPSQGSANRSRKKVIRKRQRVLDYLVPIGAVVMLATVIMVGVVLAR